MTLLIQETLVCFRQSVPPALPNISLGISTPLDFATPGALDFVHKFRSLGLPTLIALLSLLAHPQPRGELPGPRSLGGASGPFVVDV